jgi:hypothetical protein
MVEIMNNVKVIHPLFVQDDTPWHWEIILIYSYIIITSVLFKLYGIFLNYAWYYLVHYLLKKYSILIYSDFTELVCLFKIDQKHSLHTSQAFSNNILISFCLKLSSYGKTIEISAWNKKLNILTRKIHHTLPIIRLFRLFKGDNISKWSRNILCTKLL